VATLRFAKSDNIKPLYGKMERVGSEMNINLMIRRHHLLFYKGVDRMPGIELSVEAVQKNIDFYCSALAKKGYLNGSILVAYEGKVLFRKGYGMANFEHEVPNTPQTVFRIGSITKQFTAAAILLLQESNVIHVHDSVSKYLHDYPNGDKITIHHLLTHSSGIPNFTSFIDYRKMMKLPTTPEETVRKFIEMPLSFEPGENFEYSNSGYLLLSYLIEKVTGQTVETFLDETIFQAIGMKQTGVDNHKKVVRNRAMGYEIWGEVANAEYIDMSVPSGAGAMYSTIEDLFLWDRALHTERLVNRNSYVMMTTPHKDQYGYGLFQYEETIRNEKRKVIGHGGGINGFLSEYRWYVNEDLTVIVLSNLVTTQVGNIANALARLAFNDEVALPETYKAIPMNVNQYENLVGDYKIHEDTGSMLSVSVDHGKLYITHAPSFKFEICPFSQQEEIKSFFIKGVQGKVTFTGKEISFDAFGGITKATKT